MQTEAKIPADYLEILKRRKWSLILPAFLVFTASAILALALPSIYESTSTVLIEEQEIPPNLVMATVTGYAEQRLQTINQRIMSTSKLLDIINRFSLYEDLKERWTTEEIIEKMRDEIKLETISADVVDRRTGRPTTATIAFTISYEGENPQKVYQVANVLASLYLEENLRVREEQALGASTFFQEEMKNAKATLAELEAKIADFKEQNINELPELLQNNLQSLERTELDIERINEQIRTLKEREGYLRTQLASIPRDAADQDKKRLEELRVQLVYLKTRFSDEYPTVVKTKAEIAEMEKHLAASRHPTEDDHGTTTAERPPDNPAYVNLASQLSSTQADIRLLKEQIGDLYERRDDYRRRIEATPRVEEDYKALLVERNNTQAKYDELMQKYLEARVAHGLEKDQKGERFTLIDPARFPEKPIKPNRLAIALIGLVLGVGAGVGTASLKEYGDHSVRSAEVLAQVTSFPVLATIPEIITSKDVGQSRRRRFVLATTVLVTLTVGVLVVHFLVMDLDIFWAKLLRHIGRIRM
jgi:polysaccharide chain length determinant protein (PEP-CTERM system associated)